MRTMTSPRRTSTETRRGVCRGETEGVVSKVATAGELTAVTTSHRYGNESLCHPSFHRNGNNSSLRQTGCQQIAIKDSEVRDKRCDVITTSSRQRVPHPTRALCGRVGSSAVVDDSAAYKLTQKK